MSSPALAAAEPAVPTATVTACYAVTALADPGLLPRLLEPFAKLGLTPQRLHLTRLGPADSRFDLDLQVDGLTPDQAALAAARLRNVVGVETVLLSRR
jgi:hypothetical protein